MSITTNLWSAPWKDVRLSFASYKLSLVITLNDIRAIHCTDYSVFAVLTYCNKSITLIEINLIPDMQLSILKKKRINEISYINSWQSVDG